MKKIILWMLTVICQSACIGQKYEVLSPNNDLIFTLHMSHDSLFYTIIKDNQPIIEKSNVQILKDDIVIGNNIKSISLESQKVDTEYIQKEYLITDNSGESFTIEIRNYNTGIAFRYGNTSDSDIKFEDKTTFRFPAQKEIWAQKNIVHYEGSYQKYSTSSLMLDTYFGAPVTVEYGNNLYASITESGVYDFSGMRFKVNTPTSIITELHSESFVEAFQYTPWRIVMVGDLNSLANNDIIRKTVRPISKIFAEKNDWIKPGRCVWSWLAGENVSFENMKRFTKWAEELGFEYNLVDEGWSYWSSGGKNEWELVKELVDYATPLGVKILLWKAYPDRKGIDGIQTEAKVRDFFKKCKESGVAGVKIDFFDSESQEIMKYMSRTLEIAAEYQLIVNYHGCSKPTGIEFTYPNELTREGILGLEYGRSWADQNCVTPFTRFLAGHGDYTPLTFTPRYMGETTIAHQLSSAIIFNSPLMCYGGNPKDFIDSEFRDFITAIPSTWDETIVFPVSKIGNLAAFARRIGNKWFVAIMGNEPQSLEITLDFLGSNMKYKAIEVTDCVRSERDNLSKGDFINIDIDKSGGYCAILCAVQ